MIVVPQIGAEIIISAGTLIMAPNGTPVKPSALMVGVLSKPPAPKTASAVVAGPALEVKFANLPTALFSQPVEVVVPFNPSSVPPGY
jgi:hypothetical protein